MTSVRRESMDLADTRLLLNRLRVATHSDGANPKSFALLLKKTFEERAWEKEGFKSFRAFMDAPEPIGLEMTEAKMLDAARLADIEPLVRELLYQEVPAAAGRPAGRPIFNPRDTQIKAQPTTDNSERVITRLKRDDPALAERVVRGEITPNAAAREKGWRKPRIILSTPERVAESLRKWMPRESIARLAELLTQDSDRES